jgi:hypothetical protein
MRQEERKKRRRDRSGARKHRKEDDCSTPRLKNFFFIGHFKPLLFSKTSFSIAGRVFSRPAEARFELVVII